MRHNAAEFIDKDSFRAAARVGREKGAGVSSMGRVLRNAEPGSRTVRFVFSDGTVDRMGDRIDPNGWDVGPFMSNPVALFAHKSSEPPVGRALDVWSDGTRLIGDIEFASADVYPFADTVFRMIKHGFLNAVSVGFVPLDYKWADDEDRDFGIDFLQQELVEISVVPVPANANALVDAQAKGFLSRAELDRLRQGGLQQRGRSAGTEGAVRQSLQERAASLRRLREIKERARNAPSISDLEHPPWPTDREGKQERLAHIRARHGIERQSVNNVRRGVMLRLMGWG